MARSLMRPRVAVLLHKLPLLGWIWILLTTVLLVWSLDLSQERPTYEVSINPASSHAAPLRVVLYGSEYEALRRASAVSIGVKGWEVIRGSDSVTLAANQDARPIVIRTAEEPIQLGLLRYPNSSAALLSNSAGFSDRIELQAATESIYTLVVGGTNSSVPSIRMEARFGALGGLVAFVSIFCVLATIALRFWATPPLLSTEIKHPSRWEILFLALPLALSSLAIQLSFYPGNVGYDASVQWTQAAMRGDLSEPLGYSATYLMRLFTLIDPSPALLLALQEIIAAVAAALVLRELRLRGVPLWGTAIVTLGLALTPQYPSFFSNLGKDALSTLAILLFTWALLNAIRTPRGGRMCVPLLAGLVCTGLLAGLMRGNAMPAVMLAMFGTLMVLHLRHKGSRLIIAGTAFLALAFFVPQGLSMLAKAEMREYRSTDELLERPPRLFANVFIYHLFSAAVASEVPLQPEDAGIFYKLAPHGAWTKYECQMTDTTQASLSENILMTKEEYWTFLWNHQLDMAKAIGRILWKHPKILWNRQTCITRMLWYIGVGQKPFQSTAVLGYDSPAKKFIALAGQNRSLLPPLANAFQRYKQWTESASWFWLFWKPAIPLILGIFVLCMYVLRTRDAGILLGAITPLTTVLLLLIVMPFPAYRYAYPAVLIMALFSSLAFVGLPGLNQWFARRLGR